MMNTSTPSKSPQNGHMFNSVVINDGVSHFGDVNNFVYNLDNSRELRRQRFRGSLRYPEMNARRNKIASSEFARYEWFFNDCANRAKLAGYQVGQQDHGEMFDNKDDHHDRNVHEADMSDVSPSSLTSPSQFPDFRLWLQNSDRHAYVVSGKPGSGKSTFMKFIASHSITHSQLGKWSAPKVTKILFHSLWAVGSELQSNMRGLLASLLHQVCEDPIIADTISDSFPTKHHLDDWSEDDLSSLLYETLCNSDYCYCIFVDGLDEFDGKDDIDRVSDSVQRFLDLQNCKLCISTRPVHYIMDRWVGNPTLILHEMTAPDIRKHVTSVLSEKSRRIAWSISKDELLDNLTATICSRAEGVFLWIHYVLKTVCSGIRAKDDLVNLTRRIEVLPSEITDLYRVMWSKQNLDNKIHAEESSMLFQIVSDWSAWTPGPLMYVVLRLNHKLRDRYCHNLHPKDLELLEGTLENYAELVQARSAGLIEVNNGPEEPFPTVLSGSVTAFRGSRRKTRVTFIHRTVQDFLHETTFGASLLQAALQNRDWSDVSLRAYHDILSSLACIIESCGHSYNFLMRIMFSLAHLDVRHVEVVDLIIRGLQQVVESSSVGFHLPGGWYTILTFFDRYWGDFKSDFHGRVLHLNPSLAMAQTVSSLAQIYDCGRHYKTCMLQEVLLSRGWVWSKDIEDSVKFFLNQGADIFDPVITFDGSRLFYVRSIAQSILGRLIQELISENDGVDGERSSIAELRSWPELLQLHFDQSCEVSFQILEGHTPDNVFSECSENPLGLMVQSFIFVVNARAAYSTIMALTYRSRNDMWTIEDRSEMRERLKGAINYVCIAKDIVNDNTDLEPVREFFLLDKEHTMLAISAFCDNHTLSHLRDLRASALAAPCELPDIVDVSIRGISWLSQNFERLRMADDCRRTWVPFPDTTHDWATLRNILRSCPATDKADGLPNLEVHFDVIQKERIEKVYKRIDTIQEASLRHGRAHINPDAETSLQRPWGILTHHRPYLRQPSSKFWFADRRDDLDDLDQVPTKGQDYEDELD